ncbi:MAG: PspA/IM30 family protein [Candidatus Poribacteria bacterium]
MGVLERISRLIRSNINDLLDRAEDPEKILQQLITDMQQDLREAKIQVASAIREQKKLESLYQEHLTMADVWEKRAISAIKEQNDYLAKEALKRKRDCEQLAKEYKTQLDDQAKSVQSLKTGLAELEAKLSDAKRKKDLLVARQKRAQAQKTISQTMNGISRSGAFSALERIEKKVRDAEFEAQALDELKKDSLEAKFASLENDDISIELAKLKDKISKQENQ